MPSWFKNYRRLMLSIIAVIYFIACLHRHAPTVVARDLAATFNADAVALGFISSGYFYLYAAAQPLAGFLSDTIGPRRVMASFFILASLGSFMFGMAPDTTTAFIGRALVGAGAGGIFIPSLKLFSEWYRDREFAGLTGFMLAVGGLAGISATLPLTYLVLWSGWRGTFITIAFISMAMTVLCWLVLRDDPEKKGWDRALVGDPLRSAAAGEVIPGDLNVSRRLSLILGNFNFHMLSIAIFFTTGAFLTFQGLWGIPYLMDSFGLDRVRAGRLLMLFPLGFALGGPIIGIATERLRLAHKSVLLCLVALQFTQWSLLYFFEDRLVIPALMVSLFTIGFTAGGSLPMSFTITRNLFSQRLMGTAVGLVNTASFLGVAIYQPLTGFILRSPDGIQAGSFSVDAYMHLFLLFILSLAAACIAVASLRRGPT